MAGNHSIQTRITHKHDLEVNWKQAIAFVPRCGEIIIYDTEVDDDGNTLTLPEDRTVPYTYARIKIGDGFTLVNNLPFVTETITDDEIDEICNDTIATFLETTIMMLHSYPLLKLDRLQGD